MKNNNDKKQQNHDQEELKPVTLAKPTTNQHRNNKFRQNMLLKGMANTDDFDELKQIAKFKSKAGVLRTLDKLAMREEFHKALERHGLDINSIVGKLAELTESEDEKVVLKTMKTLMKAIGIDKYEDHDGGDSSWEEILLEIQQEERKQASEDGEELPEPQGQSFEYEVDKPDKPQEVIEAEKEEEDLGQSIYE